MVRWVLGGMVACVCAGCRTEADSKQEKKPLDESKMVGAADVRAFAKTAGIEPKQLRCGAIGDSRAFTCRTALTEAEVKRLGEAWGLEPDDAKNATLARGKKYGCEGFQDFSAQAESKAWASVSKPEKLAGMEYARVYFRPDSDRVCIEMEKIAPP